MYVIVYTDLNQSILHNQLNGYKLHYDEETLVYCLEMDNQLDVKKL